MNKIGNPLAEFVVTDTSLQYCFYCTTEEEAQSFIYAIERMGHEWALKRLPPLS